VSLYTTEAEYIAASVTCAQILLKKQTLIDYSITITTSPIMCDNTSAINLSKKLIQHLRTKHIDIRYYFLRDHAIKGDISLSFVSTDKQIADIFTKPLKKMFLLNLVENWVFVQFLIFKNYCI